MTTARRLYHSHCGVEFEGRMNADEIRDALISPDEAESINNYREIRACSPDCFWCEVGNCHWCLRKLR